MRNLYSDEVVISQLYVRYIHKYGNHQFSSSTWYSWLSGDRKPSRHHFVQLAKQFDIVRIEVLRKANLTMASDVFERNQKILRKWCECRRLEYCSSKFAHQDNWKHRGRMVKEFEQPAMLELFDGKPYPVFHIDQTEPLEEWLWKKKQKK